MPFQIALSGINAAFSRLKTSANNIANASTTGFKQSRTELVDASHGSTAGGVRVAQVTVQPNQGDLYFTDNALDMAVTGKGYFALNDGGSAAYARSGAFHLDRDGFLVNGEGQRLKGFLADGNGNITSTQGDLKLAATSGAPSATSRIDMGLNLDATETPPAVPFNVTDPASYNHSMTMTTYDSLGNEHQLDLYFNKTAAPGGWEMRAYQGGTQVLAATPLQFDTSGKLTSPAAGTVAVPPFNPGGGAANLNITLDVADATQYGGNFSVNSLTQDGFSSSRLTGFSISDTGIVSGRYANGQSRTIAQVGLADFSNPQGLQPLGNSSYGETHDSGGALYGTPGSGQFGLIQSGALEQSNVDLAEQLVALKQAGYQAQANAKTLQATSDMIGTLFKDKA